MQTANIQSKSDWSIKKPAFGKIKTIAGLLNKSYINQTGGGEDPSREVSNRRKSHRPLPLRLVPGRD